MSVDYWNLMESGLRIVNDSVVSPSSWVNGFAYLQGGGRVMERRDGLNVGDTHTRRSDGREIRSIGDNERNESQRSMREEQRVKLEPPISR